MKNKILTIFIVLFVVFSLFLCLPTFASANEIEDKLNESINQQIDNLDFDAVNQFADGTFVKDVIEKIKLILSGEFDDASTFLNFVLKLIFSNFTKSLPTLLGAFSIVLLCSLLTTNNAFVSQGNQKLIYFVGFVVI